MRKCTHLTPMHEFAISGTDGSSYVECLREEGHEGDHLVLSVRGTFFTWLPEHCPDCTEEECYEDPTCFVYGPVCVLEAYRLLCWGNDCSNDDSEVK